MQTGDSVKSRLETEVVRAHRFIEMLRRGERSEEMEGGGDNTIEIR